MSSEGDEGEEFLQASYQNMAHNTIKCYEISQIQTSLMSLAIL
jgi:hypothetical protein